MWWIYALLSAFFAALTTILAKVGVKDIDSNLATAIRTIVILIVAWSIVFARGGAGKIGDISRHALIYLILSGIATGLSWICYFKALQNGKASEVAPIDKSSLVLTIIFAVLFLKEALSWKIAIGSALIIVGTIVLIL